MSRPQSVSEHNAQKPVARKDPYKQHFLRICVKPKRFWLFAGNWSLITGHSQLAARCPSLSPLDPISAVLLYAPL